MKRIQFDSCVETERPVKGLNGSDLAVATLEKVRRTRWKGQRLADRERERCSTDIDAYLRRIYTQEVQHDQEHKRSEVVIWVTMITSNGSRV